MNISGFDTSIAAAQLESLFSITAIFKRRGRTVSSFNDERPLLFNLPSYGFAQRHFDALDSASFHRLVGAIARSTAGLDESSILRELPDLSEEKIHERLALAADLGMIVSENSLYRPSRNVGF